MRQNLAIRMNIDKIQQSLVGIELSPVQKHSIMTLQDNKLKYSSLDTMQIDKIHSIAAVPFIHYGNKTVFM
jgi:hypothetical protein